MRRRLLSPAVAAALAAVAVDSDQLYLDPIESTEPPAMASAATASFSQ